MGHASAAQPPAAPEFGAGEFEPFAENPKERGVRGRVRGLGESVDRELNHCSSLACPRVTGVGLAATPGRATASAVARPGEKASPDPGHSPTEAGAGAASPCCCAIDGPARATVR